MSNFYLFLISINVFLAFANFTIGNFGVGLFNIFSAGFCGGIGYLVAKMENGQ